MRELVRLYNQFGVRATFNAEMMQQLVFRKHQDAHPELKALADRWDAEVIDAFKQGHDIQLHLHTQWSKASCENGQWRLEGDWSILNYDIETSREMIASGKEYLETLLQPIDPNYVCVAFRAGALCIAPSPHILNLLSDAGIRIDTSIVGGLRVHTRNLQFDYSNCEEDLLPYYPRMDDARRVSDKPEKIVCVPIHHFRGSRRQVIKQVVSIGRRKVSSYLKTQRPKGNSPTSENYSQKEWADVARSSRLGLVYDKAIKPSLQGKHLTSDFSRLNDAFMREMLRDIRRRAATSGLAKVPIVLTNHSKYIEDYGPIERFLRDASAADDIEFITLTELERKISDGEFKVKTASGSDVRVH